MQPHVESTPHVVPAPREEREGTLTLLIGF